MAARYNKTWTGVLLTSVCVAALADTLGVDTLFRGGNMVSAAASPALVEDVIALCVEEGRFGEVDGIVEELDNNDDEGETGDGPVESVGFDNENEDGGSVCFVECEAGKPL